MTYNELVFKLYHRGMLAMWVIFVIFSWGLLYWARQTASIPLPLPLDGWTMLRFIPVMMGAVTLFSCLQFLGLSNIRLYFTIRTLLIVSICFVAYISTGKMIAEFGKLLPYIILLGEIILLLTFAEKIDHEKLTARMIRRLPVNNGKYKPVVWPPLKFGSFCLWTMFSSLGGIILFLTHEGWPLYIDLVLTSLPGATLWWALTAIGVLAFWQWVLIWVHTIAQTVHGIIRGVLYAIFVPALVFALYGLGIGINILLIMVPLALMSIIFSGEYESMRMWNRTHDQY